MSVDRQRLEDQVKVTKLTENRDYYRIGLDTINIEWIRLFLLRCQTFFKRNGQKFSVNIILYTSNLFSFHLLNLSGSFNRELEINFQWKIQDWHLSFKWHNQSFGSHMLTLCQLLIAAGKVVYLYEALR